LFNTCEHLGALCLDTRLTADVSFAGSDERFDARRRDVVLAEIPRVRDHGSDACASARLSEVRFRCCDHGRELRAIVGVVRHLSRDDDLIDGRGSLRVVALHEAGRCAQ
jgi:hypothetical protein